MDVHELVNKLKALAKELGKTPTAVEFEKQCGISARQIKKHVYSKLVDMAGLMPNPHPSYAKTSILEAPKLLIIDIELAPLIVHAWGLNDQFIGMNQMVQDWFILSYAAKWYGCETIFYLDQRYSEPLSDDRMLCEAVHHLLSQAHYICGHNIARFDLKKINARFLKHGLKPVGPFIIIDTLRIARKHFAMTSNKLEYVAKFLGCTPKSKHHKFDGMELWNECMKSNQEAFIEMELYNKQDVTTTEEVMVKLLPYENLNFQAHFNAWACTCGSSEFFKDGLAYRKSGTFQIYTCRKCGKRLVSKDNLTNKNTRKEFLK